MFSCVSGASEDQDTVFHAEIPDAVEYTRDLFNFNFRETEIRKSTEIQRDITTSYV